MAHPPGSLACNLAAITLLGPLFAVCALFATVQGIASGAVFTMLWRIGALLPVDPDIGGPVLAALMAGGVLALVIACVRVAWLFPSLLLLQGGLAEAYVLAGVGLPGPGEIWVPAFGVAGIGVSAIQLWRAMGWLEDAEATA